MTRSEILDGIRDVAREYLGWEDEIGEEMNMVKTLRLDSLRLLILVMEVENRFSVCLDEGTEFAMETVGDLLDVIQEKLSHADTE
jgi:acyl carrier protein